MIPEILATSEVKALFSLTGRLDPHITEGDKGVSWDGYVDVYGSAGSNHREDDWLGSIAVQVKSEQKVPAEERFTYPVKVARIRNYSNNSPTLYLVVRIGTDGTSRKVYYHVFHEDDYKNLKLRSDWQQTKNCWFKAFPTEPDKVEALVLELLEIKLGSHKPVYDPPLEEPEDNLFLYNAEAVGFFGRKEEMDELRAFLDAPGDFRWWGIAGPGGAGKSRLAYEFCKDLDPDNGDCWQSHKLEHDDYRDLRGVVDLYHAPLLLVADYAQSHQKEIADFIESQRGRKRGYKLRLLLLDRDGGEDGGKYPWEQWLLDSEYGEHVREARYDLAKSILHLEPLPDDAILQLIQNYAEELVKREKLAPLPDNRAEELFEKLKEFGEGGNRALYAMLLTDAAMREPDRTDWDLQDLLNKPLMREEAALKRAVATLTGDDELIAACQLIQRVATALGTSGDLTYRELEELCPKALEVLDGTFVSPEERLHQVGLVSVHEDEMYVSAIRPDILGEYAIFQFLRKCSKVKDRNKDYFFNAVLNRTESLISFYLHLLRDNRRYLESGKSPEDEYGKLLPRTLNLDKALKSSYAALIAEVFDWALSYRVKSYLVDTLKAINLDGIEDDVEKCRAFNSLGYMLNMMGQYEEALTYYEQGLNAVGMTLDLERLDESMIREKTMAAPHAAKCYSNAGAARCEMGDYDIALALHRHALSIREQCFDADNPAVATSLHNIGYVYDKKGDYDNALTWHMRAIAIREKAVYEKRLGSEYFNLSTSYSNIGVMYGHMGDYDQALRYLERARKIREEKYGPEHSSVATCLDHMGNVLAKKGDDFDQALDELNGALAIREKTLGGEHPSIAASCQNIGNVHFKRGEYGEALEFFKRGLKIAEESLGPKHRVTVSLREKAAHTREIIEG